MRFNPFEEKPMPLDQLFMDWDKLRITHQKQQYNPF